MLTCKTLRKIEKTLITFDPPVRIGWNTYHWNQLTETDLMSQESLKSNYWIPRNSSLGDLKRSLHPDWLGDYCAKCVTCNTSITYSFWDTFIIYLIYSTYHIYYIFHTCISYIIDFISDSCSISSSYNRYSLLHF